MLSLLISTIYFTSFVNSCSIAVPSEGVLYVSNVELLSVTDYADDVLLTIRRTTDQTGTGSSRLTFTDYGPWCKIMNVNTGTVSDVVTCSDYTKAIRSYATPDTDTDTKTTSVGCDDNCDGETATCTIIRDGISYTITDIPYSASSTTCNTTSDTQPITIGGGIFVSFTIKDISTTYISFATNMVGIEFDDSGTSPVGYNVYTVQRVGNWNYLTPGGFGVNTAPSIYSDVNVISVNLPCCLCYGSSLSSYNIKTDTTAMTQIFTLTSIGSDTKIDAVKARGINYGLYYSDTVIIYDLSNGDSNSFEPDLCDFIQQCLVAPCDDTKISCPYNPNARCVDDYCGGCNARWFCGQQDITHFCDATPPQSIPMCPDPSTTTTTTQEPTTTDRVTTTESKTTTMDRMTTKESKTTTTDRMTSTESKTTETTDEEPGFCEVSTTATCGGKLDTECSVGICMDDPTDACDPNNGDVDCIGICRPFRWLLLNKICDFCLCEDGNDETCEVFADGLSIKLQNRFLKACYQYVGDCAFDNVDIIDPSDIEKCDCSMFYCASPNCICSEKYDPYCCKGNEFENFCNAICGGYELNDCNNNKCGECICTKEYNPQCCDGNKYGNPCNAKCDGFDVDTECFQLTLNTECSATNGAASIFGGLFIIGFGFVIAVFS